jgi:UDP-N-acetylglucosamine transferase subunit ALG13
VSAPLVVAMVGTDHHPFDRLVGWLDRLAASLGPRVEIVVQHGHSARPQVARGVEFVDQDELTDLLGRAAVVVCHGGPGTIMDARRAGHVPVCVPRDPSRGEHVDGHQERFAAVVDDAGVVRLATDFPALADGVSAALSASGPQVDAAEIETAAEESAERFARQIDPVVGRRVRRVRSVRRTLLSRVTR